MSSLSRHLELLTPNPSALDPQAKYGYPTGSDVGDNNNTDIQLGGCIYPEGSLVLPVAAS